MPAEGTEPGEESRLAPVGVELAHHPRQGYLHDLLGRMRIVTGPDEGEPVEAWKVGLEELFEGPLVSGQQALDQMAVCGHLGHDTTSVPIV